jgi:hypothetical protein
MQTDLERLKSIVSDLQDNSDRSNRRSNSISVPSIFKDYEEIREKVLLHDIKINDHDAKINLILRTRKRNA